MPRCFVIALCLCGVSLSYLSTEATAVAADPSYPSNEPSVLVLRNGRLVSGHISQSAGGYMVAYPTGRMMVPFTQVNFQAASVESAYARLRETLPPGSATARLALARWCLTNGLTNIARNEVEIVLKAEPDHDGARRMLKRIDELLDPKREIEQPKKTLAERMMAPEVTSLAGLSSNVASRYVSRIQPIMMNSCALAGCHGPQAKNGFQLERVRLTAGNRRSVSERNLAMALRFVSTANHEKSALLVKPRGNHGVRGRAIFRGRSGATQLAELQSWVGDVSRETGRTQTTDTAPRIKPTELPTGSGDSEFQRTGRSSTFRVGGPKPNYISTPGLQAAKTRLEQRRITNSLNRTAKKPGRKKTETDDPFDPAEFNRQNAVTTQPPLRPTPQRERYP